MMPNKDNVQEMPQEENKGTRRTFLSRAVCATGILMAGSASSMNANETSKTDKIPRHGRFTVLASEAGAKLDSHVATGGGTDDTAILQAILDKAVEWGSLHLVLDGAALVRGLKIYSNTTIECPTKACGLFLKGKTNAPLLRNAHLRMKGERLDKNITLLGGTYNHNCTEQVHDYKGEDAAWPLDEIPEFFKSQVWNHTFDFFGVENFTARDLTIRDQRTFALLMSNFYRVVFENIDIDLPHKVKEQNQDGLHFFGPGQFLTLRNISGDAGDDFIALAPDESDKVSDMTDVIIDGVFLKDADQGIRLLSRGTGRLDRVIIRNVTGTYRSFGFYIEPWFNATGGNFGNIIFDTIDLRATKPNYIYRPPFLFSVGGTIESLVLRNISHHQPADDRILFDLGVASCMKGLGEEGNIPEMNIQSLLIDGLRIFEPNLSEKQPAIVDVSAPIGRLILRNVEIMSKNGTPEFGTLVRVKKGGKVGLLTLDRIDKESIKTAVQVEPGGTVAKTKEF